jgi:hypothetical protein
MIRGPTGFPAWEYRGVCTQRVGVKRRWDATNVERRFCAKPGHREDVERQARAAELAERVRHETQPEPRAAVYSPRDMVAIRPEMIRDVR